MSNQGYDGGAGWQNNPPGQGPQQPQPQPPHQQYPPPGYPQQPQQPPQPQQPQGQPGYPPPQGQYPGYPPSGQPSQAGPPPSYPSPYPPSHGAPAPRTSRAPFIVAGAIVLAGLLVALGILFMRQPAAPGAEDVPPAPVTTESTPAEPTAPGNAAEPTPEESDPAAPAPETSDPAAPAVEPSTPAEEPGDPLGDDRMISVADLPAEAAGYTVSDMAGLPVYTKGSEQIMLLNFGISMPMEEWAMGAEVTKVADNAGCFFAEGVQMCVVATEEFGDVQMSSSGSDITPLVEALAEHFR